MAMMIFMFLCFAGLFLMFFFILRNQEKSRADMCEECAQLRLLLRNMDARLAALGGESPDLRPASAERLDALSMENREEEERRERGGLELRFDPREDRR